MAESINKWQNYKLERNKKKIIISWVMYLSDGHIVCNKSCHAISHYIAGIMQHLVICLYIISLDEFPIKHGRITDVKQLCD